MRLSKNLWSGPQLVAALLQEGMQRCISWFALWGVIQLSAQVTQWDTLRAMQGSLCAQCLTPALIRCLFQTLLKVMGIYQLSSVNFGLCFDCVFVLIQHHVRIRTVLSLCSVVYGRVLNTLEFSCTTEILGMSLLRQALSSL